MIRPLLLVSAAAGNELALADALMAALDGTGPAVVPVRELDAHGATRTGGPVHVPPDTALAVSTSGSSTKARTVLLSRWALRASALATETRLGGPGQWMLALPASHIAGLQVLVRAAIAGMEPVIADLADGFTPGAFITATEQLTGPRRYVSLVPTQLHRLLDDETARAALATYDVVLLGGAAAVPTLLARAAGLGTRIVRTYGMTETSGGCVYDGRPLDGVEARIDSSGRIHLAGPVLATGYLGRPDLDAATFLTVDGVRWLRTDDAGSFGPDGTLHVIGRLDDVLSTGGVKVAPTAVEAALTELDDIAQACVVGIPDEEWGSRVVAVVVPVAGRHPDLAQVRDHVTRTLGSPAAPRRLVVTESLPERGPGKVDRRAVLRLAQAEAEG